jgi:tyrosinase
MLALRALLASLLVGLFAMSAAVRPAGAEIRVRKDVKDLTAKQRRDFVSAVIALKRTPSPYDPSLSYYDQFVAWHVELSRCNPTDPFLTHIQKGHQGPIFLAWHREFVLLFEEALREVSGKNLAVPYWDWTSRRSTEAVFADDFMGGNGNPDEGWAVTGGPFRKGSWELKVQPIGFQWAPSATPYVTRHFGSWPDSPLPSREDVGYALDAPRYDVPPYGTESDPAKSFRNALEGFRPPLSSLIACGPDGVVSGALTHNELHNAVHLWTGGIVAPQAGGTRVVGTMANVPSSPNDPVFFLHHAMIDRIWAQWQQSHGVDTYLPRTGFPHNNADDLMQPYADGGIRVTPADVADTRALGYRYSSTERQRRRPRGQRRSEVPSFETQVQFSCGLVPLGRS